MLLLDGGTLLLVTPCHNGSGKGKSSQEGRGSNKNCHWDANCVWHSDSCQGCSTAGKNLGLSRGQAGIQSRANTWKVVLAIRTLWPAVTLLGPSPAAALRAQLRPHQLPLTLKDLRKGESEAVLLLLFLLLVPVGISAQRRGDFNAFSLHWLRNVYPPVNNGNCSSVSECGCSITALSRS